MTLRALTAPATATALKKRLTKVMSNGTFSYTFAGHILEKEIQDHLTGLFPNGRCSNNKNSFPDFSVGNRAIEIKCGNTRQRSKNATWTNVSCPENDMGTIRSWKSKISQWGCPIYIFVVYTIDDKCRTIDDIIIGPFYQFLGIVSKDNTLKYREKDGNLRPCKFADMKSSAIKDLETFEKLLEETDLKRNRSIISKKFICLEHEQRTKILEELTLIHSSDSSQSTQSLEDISYSLSDHTICSPIESHQLSIQEEIHSITEPLSRLTV